MIPYFNIQKLKTKTTFPEEITFGPEILTKKEPKPYFAKGIWYKDYGLVAADKFDPRRYQEINTFPRKFRWIDEKQYDLRRLSGSNWGNAGGDKLPPAHMVFNKGKFWPSNSGFIKGERIHDAVMLDIVENYFARGKGKDRMGWSPRTPEQSFFMGNVEDIGTLVEKPNRLNHHLILNDKASVRNYPFMNLKPITYYEEPTPLDYFDRLLSKQQKTSPQLITYARPMLIRDHVGSFVSSIIPMFGTLYSNYPLDELYPHIFEKAE